MSLTLEEFTQAKKVYDNATDLAKTQKMSIWSVYELIIEDHNVHGEYIPRPDIPDWQFTNTYFVFVDYYVDKAEASKNIKDWASQWNDDCDDKIINSDKLSRYAIVRDIVDATETRVKPSILMNFDCTILFQVKTTTTEPTVSPSITDETLLQTSREKEMYVELQELRQIVRNIVPKKEITLYTIHECKCVIFNEEAYISCKIFGLIDETKLPEYYKYSY